MNKVMRVFMIFLIVLVFVLAITTVYFIKQTNESNDTLITTKNNLNTTLNELSTTKDEFNLTKENLQDEIEKSAKLKLALDEANSELEITNTTINDLKSEEYKLVYLGDYSITHYCTERYEHICGTGVGITATGTTVTAGRTVAVDPSVIPYGTKIYIEGYGWRVAEDCGGAVNGKHIDIAVDSHEYANAMGSVHKSVWIIVQNS